MNEYMDMLGHKARDRVTGFKGVVASVIFDLYGCVSVVLTPEVDTKDGKHQESFAFDAKRVTVTSKTRVMEPPPFQSLPKGAEIGAAERPANWP